MASASHVLVIDDNQTILDVFELLLSDSYSVTTRRDAGDIVETVSEISPDLIILDWWVGSRSGCNYSAILKSNDRLRHIPIIIISTDITPKAECLSAGADEFIEKPFEVAFINKRIAHHLYKGVNRA